MMIYGDNLIVDMKGFNGIKILHRAEKSEDDKWCICAFKGMESSTYTDIEKSFEYLLPLHTSNSNEDIKRIFAEMKRDIIRGKKQLYLSHYIRRDAQAETQQPEDIPIEEVDMTVRTFNCLKRTGYNTLGDIAALSEIEATEIKYFNRRELLEVKEILSRHGLKFKDWED